MKKKAKRKIPVFIYLIVLAILGSAILVLLRLKFQENFKKANINIGEQSDSSQQDELIALPEDFPVYQNSKLVTFAQSEDGKGISYIWETDDEADLVYGGLKAELRIGGWELSDSSSVGGSSTVSFKRGDVGGFLGVFIGGSGKTTISVSIRKP